MARKTSPHGRPTLMDARVGTIPDIIDELIDCYAGTAASRITRMDRRQLELVVLHLVRSVDPRWRFTKPLPLPSSDEATENTRRIIADMLTAHPALIVPAALALGDAIKAHDPRPCADLADTPHAPEQDAA